MSENKRDFNGDAISSNVIEIPSYLSKMLTEWSKAAIRTNPSDILLWSALYFRMKANGERPPVKPYLDPPDLKVGPGGLTPNCLKALATTLSYASVPYEKIEKMWEILSLEKNIFLEIIQIGKFDKHINPKDFIGISAAYLNNRLRDTMVFLCSIFSENDSNGILLEHFVAVYQFLARLDCADEPNQPSTFEPEEKMQNIEENTLSYASQSIKSRSLMSSAFENESDCNVIDDTNFFDTESTRGIPFWVDDKIDDLESITDMLNKPTTETPMDNTLCDDPNYLLSLKQLRQNSSSDDLSSLLSASSVISGSGRSVASFVSSTEMTRFSTTTTTAINVEEFENDDNGEMVSESISSKFEDLYFDEVYADNRNEDDLNETIIQEKTSEKSNETSVVEKYEDEESITDIYIGEGNVERTKIEVNKNFIVMLALVSNVNDPLPNTENVDGESDNAENKSSAESEFSLLEKIELNDNTTEQADNNKVNDVQTFDEKDYINVGKESSDSDKSSDSGESQYSEIDQQSNLSAALEDDLAKSSTEIEIKDRDRLLHDGSSASAQFEHMELAEEFERNDETHEGNEEHLELSEVDSIESETGENLDVEMSAPEEPRIFVLPGIGPAIAEEQIERVITWVTKCASRQNNIVYHHNLFHFLSPPLDHKSMTTSSTNNVDTV